LEFCRAVDDALFGFFSVADDGEGSCRRISKSSYDGGAGFRSQFVGILSAGESNKSKEGCENECEADTGSVLSRSRASSDGAASIISLTSSGYAGSGMDARKEGRGFFFIV